MSNETFKALEKRFYEVKREALKTIRADLYVYAQIITNNGSQAVLGTNVFETLPDLGATNDVQYENKVRGLFPRDQDAVHFIGLAEALAAKVAMKQFTLEEKREILYGSTSNDYKGVGADGIRRVLDNENGATVSVPLDSLTDDDIRRKFRYSRFGY